MSPGRAVTDPGALCLVPLRVTAGAVSAARPNPGRGLRRRPAAVPVEHRCGLDSPPWKHRLAYVQEMFAIRVFRITKGEPPHLESAAIYRKHIEAAGADVVHMRPLGTWRPHPHFLFVARKR